jgi:hypothetical protein
VVELGLGAVFGPITAICVQAFLFVERSILNPSSLLALSVHVKRIELVDNGWAVRLLGAAGRAGGGGGGA